MQYKSLFLAVALAALPGPSQAAAITWSLGSSFLGSGGETTVLNNGTAVYAYNFGNTADYTVNGVTFNSQFPGNPWGAWLAGSSPGTGNAAFNAMIETFVFVDVNLSSVFSQAFTLTGLTIGSQYQLQLFIYDARTCCSARTMLVSDGAGGNSPSIVHGEGRSLIGTFTADAATQALVFSSSQAFVVSALSLRDVTVTGAPIPEPSTALLLSFGGLAMAGLRRRLR